MINNQLTKKVLSGQLINDDIIDQKISPQELEVLVHDQPSSSYLRIYNDIFDTESHIFKLNGQWHYWHDSEQKLHLWNWEKDIDEIIQSIEPDETDELERFNNGWSIFNNGEYSELCEYSIHQLNSNTLINQ